MLAHLQQRAGVWHHPRSHPGRPLTREQELREAIEKARIPAREYRIYRALFARAEWKSAVIKRQFQPRSLAELAGLAHMSKASVAAGLNHLQRHGWVVRHRHVTAAGIGGRGHGTRYELARAPTATAKRV